MQRQSIQRIGRCANASRHTLRYASTETSTSPATSTDAPPPLRAAMLVHRSPLLTPTPTPFESAYYAYNTRLRMALSNPVPLDFYYKKGSLTERRFQRAQWAREREVFGERLAGKKVDVGDIPAEEVVQLETRTEGDEPGGRGQGGEGDRTRVERVGAGDVYLLVKDKKSASWGLPVGGLRGKEALHEAAVRSLADGLGKGMDTWLVTRKPIGLIEGQTDAEHTFIFKSHILTGSPALTNDSPYSEYAWLTKEEIRQAMGDGAAWSQVEPLLN